MKLESKCTKKSTWIIFNPEIWLNIDILEPMCRNKHKDNPCYVLSFLPFQTFRRRHPERALLRPIQTQPRLTGGQAETRGPQGPGGRKGWPTHGHHQQSPGPGQYSILLFIYLFVEKRFCHGGQTNEQLLRRMVFEFVPATPSPWSHIFEGPFELTQCPSRALNLVLYVAFWAKDILYGARLCTWAE